jgi:hypothetical protein
MAPGQKSSSLGTLAGFSVLLLVVLGLALAHSIQHALVLGIGMLCLGSIILGFSRSIAAGVGVGFGVCCLMAILYYLVRVDSHTAFPSGGTSGAVSKPVLICDWPHCPRPAAPAQVRLTFTIPGQPEHTDVLCEDCLNQQAFLLNEQGWKYVVRELGSEAIREEGPRDPARAEIRALIASNLTVEERVSYLEAMARRKTLNANEQVLLINTILGDPIFFPHLDQLLGTLAENLALSAEARTHLLDRVGELGEGAARLRIIKILSTQLAEPPNERDKTVQTTSESDP